VIHAALGVSVAVAGAVVAGAVVAGVAVAGAVVAGVAASYNLSIQVVVAGVSRSSPVRSGSNVPVTPSYGASALPLAKAAAQAGNSLPSAPRLICWYLK